MESVNLNTSQYDLFNLNNKYERQKNESHRNLWENSKSFNIYITGISEGEGKWCGIEKAFK